MTLTSLPIFSLPRRAWRRLGRVPGFERPVLFTEDRAEQIAFWADVFTRHRGSQDFCRLLSIKDHFDFSCRFFGPHQLESEIMAFLRWASPLKPRTVCEIGTAMGGTTYLLGQSLETVEHLIGIDLFIHRRQRLRYFSRPGQQLDFVEGSSHAPETLARVRAHLGDRKIDLLFIDGDHTLAGVAKDFVLYRPFVRDGGVIVFHDIVGDHRARFGRDTGRWAGEVPLLWAKIKPFYRTHEFVESPAQDGLGIGVIEYDPTIILPPLP